MNNDFTGSWRLCCFEQINVKTGHKSYPLGNNPIGLLIYTNDGRMSVNIMSSNREMFLADDIMAGKDAEIISAYKAYTSYSGNYAVEDDKIVHNIIIALFPNIVGTKQIRYYEFRDENILLLKTPEIFVNNEIQIAYITWERER